MTKLEVGQIYKLKHPNDQRSYFPKYIIIVSGGRYKSRLTVLYNDIEHLNTKPFEEYTADVSERYERVDDKWLK